MDNIIHLNPGITPPLIPNHGLHLIMDDKKHTLVLNMILGTLTRRNIHDVKPLAGGPTAGQRREGGRGGGGTILSGAAERERGVRGVWGGNHGRIPVGSLDDSTREGRTTAAPLGPPDDWGGQVIR